MVLGAFLEVACNPGMAVLFQTLSFDLQQRLTDEEGTNMVRPSPPLSSDLSLQLSEECWSFMSLSTLFVHPSSRDLVSRGSGTLIKKHLAWLQASLWHVQSSDHAFATQAAYWSLIGCASCWGSLQPSYFLPSLWGPHRGFTHLGLSPLADFHKEE